MLASLLLQMQVVTDGTRFAARRAAFMSNLDLSCSALEGLAVQEAGSFMSQYASTAPLAGLAPVWSSENAPIQAHVGTASWDGFSRQRIELTMTLSQASWQRHFGNLLPQDGMQVTSTFMLDRPCT